MIHYHPSAPRIPAAHPTSSSSQPLTTTNTSFTTCLVKPTTVQRARGRPHRRLVSREEHHRRALSFSEPSITRPPVVTNHDFESDLIVTTRAITDNANAYTYSVCAHPAPNPRVHHHHHTSINPPIALIIRGFIWEA